MTEEEGNWRLPRKVYNASAVDTLNSGAVTRMGTSALSCSQRGNVIWLLAVSLVPSQRRFSKRREVVNPALEGSYTPNKGSEVLPIIIMSTHEFGNLRSATTGRTNQVT